MLETGASGYKLWEKKGLNKRKKRGKREGTLDFTFLHFAARRSFCTLDSAVLPVLGFVLLLLLLRRSEFLKATVQAKEIGFVGQKFKRVETILAMCALSLLTASCSLQLLVVWTKLRSSTTPIPNPQRLLPWSRYAERPTRYPLKRTNPKVSAVWSTDQTEYLRMLCSALYPENV